MKIAILIPVYNAEKFLRECLDSALASAREVEKLGSSCEIYCKDDGSKDGSRAILAEYAECHANLHFSFQENAGVAVTRNRLMEELPADVEAFGFLDADDTIKSEMYIRLIEAMIRTKADVVECEWEGEERVIEDMSIYLLRSTAPGHWINVWNKLYLRAAIGAIRFPLGFAFEEDFLFNFRVHQAIRRKALVPGAFHYYRSNPDSATSTLNQRRYFDATTGRIRLSITEFLNAGRIPDKLRPAFCAELSKDAYRMCIRKNLKKNRDSRLCRQLFGEAGAFLAKIENDYGFVPMGLNPIQRLIYGCCRRNRYLLAKLLVFLT